MLADTAWNAGCEGGDMVEAYKYVKAKGVAKESSYPAYSHGVSDVRRLNDVSNHVCMFGVHIE
jgi:hypothetical protein